MLKARLNSSVIRENTSEDKLNILTDYFDGIRKLRALTYYLELETDKHIDVTVIEIAQTNLYYSPMFNAYFFPDEVEIIPE